MYEILNPRPNEADKPVVRFADSVTHFIYPASQAQYGETHYIVASGKCLYCKQTRSVLAKRYGIL
jgi:hypothetical protein